MLRWSRRCEASPYDLEIEFRPRHAFHHGLGQIKDACGFDVMFLLAQQVLRVRG